MMNRSAKDPRRNHKPLIISILNQGQFFPFFILTLSGLVTLPLTYSLLKPPKSKQSCFIASFLLSDRYILFLFCRTRKHCSAD